MTFGAYLRKTREQHGISLRKFAYEISLSATYISKFERGEFPPPSEAVIKRLATFFSIDSDVLLAKAGRVDSELIAIILSDPVYYCALIRNKSAK